MDDNLKKEIQSATLERLMKHLDERKDVQNIDLMNLAGFCRNCLSRWYREEAEKKGVEISDPDAREHVYGMPYSEWKENSRFVEITNAGMTESHVHDVQITKEAPNYQRS